MTLSGAASRSKTTRSFFVRRGRTGDRASAKALQGWIAMAWSDGSTIGLNAYNDILDEYESNRITFRSRGLGLPEKGHIFYTPVDPLIPEGGRNATGFVSSRVSSQPSLSTVIAAFEARRGTAIPRVVFFIRESADLAGPVFAEFADYIHDTFPLADTPTSLGTYWLSAIRTLLTFGVDP